MSNVSTGTCINPYEELDIEFTNDQLLIKSAYQRALLLYHPDKCIDNNITKFHNIQEAYKILTNKEMKLEIDMKIQQLNANTEEVSLNEFIQSNDNSNNEKGSVIIYTKACRCGDFYEVIIIIV